MITRKDLFTINSVPGKTVVEVLGYVKHLGKDILAGFKSLIGGEINSYTEMMNDARKIATERLLKDAEALGANGVIGFRLQTSAVMGGAAEIIAYGTAVKFE